ncbi:hypothetical protein DM860_011916 [Cuscuta australis]|uniref:Histidine-containing phosphotransfer protein n=1 Tax=Cuscuta australis TaxID=267555 RepID=A0A328DDZ3_9ASTE|nr:hypothetical protein DM860_011916 [Cuscuta australis]
MEVVIQLQNQFVGFMNSLYSEGFLDDQFLQLQKLQDETNPDFVVEVVSLFFKDSEILLQKMANCFQQQFVDFEQVDAHVHQLKGSSSSIGAQRVKNACISFAKQCEKSPDRYMRCLLQLNREYIDVRNKLQALITLERQILAAGGTVPVLSCTR